MDFNAVFDGDLLTVGLGVDTGGAGFDIGCNVDVVLS